MKTTELNERDVQGKEVDAKDYPVLYHLTDYQGLTHTAINNGIYSKSNYLSTTYSPEMLTVGGRMHYHFRFTIDGGRAISDFKGHEYSSYAMVVGGGTHKWEEAEIGLQTKFLPLDYITEMSFIPDIKSRVVVQWLFYKTTSDINGATALEYLLGKGIKLKTVTGDKISVEDRYFLERCIELKDRSYNDAMRELVNVFEISDFDNGKITPTRWSLENRTDEMKADCNKLAGKFGSFDIKEAERDITKWIKIIDPDNADALVQKVQRSGIINHYLTPTRMFGLLRTLIKYDRDEFDGYLEMVQDEHRKQKQFGSTEYINHYPTG